MYITARFRIAVATRIGARTRYPSYPVDFHCKMLFFQPRRFSHPPVHHSFALFGHPVFQTPTLSQARPVLSPIPAPVSFPKRFRHARREPIIHFVLRCSPSLCPCRPRSRARCVFGFVFGLEVRFFRSWVQRLEFDFVDRSLFGVEFGWQGAQEGGTENRLRYVHSRPRSGGRIESPGVHRFAVRGVEGETLVPDFELRVGRAAHHRLRPTQVFQPIKNVQKILFLVFIQPIVRSSSSKAPRVVTRRRAEVGGVQSCRI
eukprot:1368312-Amorphochlora_amoeboformis.AAC.1